MNKICHFTSVHPRYDTRIFFKQCKTLINNGYNVSLVVADGLEDEIIDGIKIYNVKKGRAGRLARMTLIAYKVYRKSIGLDSDVYHFHDPELLIAAYFLKRRGKLVIYDVHEDVPQDILIKTWLPLGTKKLISLLYTTFEKFVVRRLDHVITSTEFIFNRFYKYQTKTTCIKNYSLKDDILEDVDWNAKSVELCYIGGISKVRGISEMINLVQASGYRLNLAGLFENDKLFEVVKSLEGWNNVNYHGYVSRVVAKQMLRESKIGLLLLHPTKTHLDSLPIKLFEYMAAGLPILASDIEGWREIIGQSECGYCVDPFDTKLQKEKLEFIINNPIVAEQMGKNGRKAVEERFNWEIEAQKLINIYINLS